MELLSLVLATAYSLFIVGATSLVSGIQSATRTWLRTINRPIHETTAQVWPIPAN